MPPSYSLCDRQDGTTAPRPALPLRSYSDRKRITNARARGPSVLGSSMTPLATLPEAADFTPGNPGSIAGAVSAISQPNQHLEEARTQRFTTICTIALAAHPRLRIRRLAVSGRTGNGTSVWSKEQPAVSPASTPPQHRTRQRCDPRERPKKSARRRGRKRR